MKTSGILALLAAFGIASVCAAPVEGVEADKREADSNLPGLDTDQSKNARSIIAENKKMKLGKQGCLAGITTAITEVCIPLY